MRCIVVVACGCLCIMRREDSGGALPKRSKSSSTDGEEGAVPSQQVAKAPSASTEDTGGGLMRARRCNRAALCRLYRCMTPAAVSRTRSIASLSPLWIWSRFAGVCQALALRPALAGGSRLIVLCCTAAAMGSRGTEESSVCTASSWAVREDVVLPTRGNVLGRSQACAITPCAPSPPPSAA